MFESSDRIVQCFYHPFAETLVEDSVLVLQLIKLGNVTTIAVGGSKFVYSESDVESLLVREANSDGVQGVLTNLMFLDGTGWTRNKSVSFIFDWQRLGDSGVGNVCEG